jgi:peptidoglycan/xylan/chitin deacetylase (PgdA/CDA1 family)
MKHQFTIGLLLWLSILPAQAAGPAVLARAERALWPDGIAAQADYNRASRAEALVFVNALNELADRDDETLKAALDIKSVDRAAIGRLRERLLTRLFENYRRARQSCVPDEAFCPPVDSPAALVEQGRLLASQLPARYRPWFAGADAFHRRYAGELLRLAALFPKVSSEIDSFGAHERSGLELADGHFLWTFDDGPTGAGGTTDALLPVLAQQDIHGIFFVLGERLQKRLQKDGAPAVQALYDGQCVALHGWSHESHQKSPRWQASILETRDLVQNALGTAYRPYFRPPYGQRRADSAAFFVANDLSVALWNIDSQDWNSRLDDRQAAERVLTLMLLWRRGVILFHDSHGKAARAIPWIVAQTRGAGLHWEDCRRY